MDYQVYFRQRLVLPHMLFIVLVVASLNFEELRIQEVTHMIDDTKLHIRSVKIPSLDGISFRLKLRAESSREGGDCGKGSNTAVARRSVLHFEDYRIHPGTKPGVTS